MGSKKWATPAGFAVGIPMLGLLAATLPQELGAQGPPPPVGGPLPGLTQQQMNRFNQGRNEFLQIENQGSGLGPVFNGVSCVQCHAAGAPGGASPAPNGVSVVTRIGAIVGGSYSDLEAFGGPLIQARSLREFNPNYPIPREVVPVQAQFVSRRITTPIFGMGLIEEIPSTTILSRSGVNQGNGVMGVANMVVNPDTGLTELGRFGWKAQVSTAHAFSGDAYLNEMGITNPTFGTESAPQGGTIPPGADIVPDPEDEAGDAVGLLADFMRFTAPPNPLPPTVGSGSGARLFNQIQCTSCHVPRMTTGVSPVAALSQKQVNLYSDLLLHRMGAGLADGIRQGQAEGDQFRTPPLWGLRFRQNVLLHDGRANSIDLAIRLHGGEAQIIRDKYVGLTILERQQIVEFLSRL